MKACVVVWLVLGSGFILISVGAWFNLSGVTFFNCLIVFCLFLVHCLMGVSEIPNTKFQFLPLSLVFGGDALVLWVFGNALAS